MELPPYQPVNCNFYDELEALAVMHKSVEIAFKSELGAISRVWTTIRDFRTREGSEWLLTGSGLEIRLDMLVEVDGKQPDNYC